MADKKISALTAATTPLAGTEVLPIVQSGSTVKVSIADVTAGRSVSASGIVNSLGAVGTPSYTFTGDLNTGMWSPAADTIAMSTAGAERMRLDSAGNVGIGTTSPAFWSGKLTVDGGNIALANGGRSLFWNSGGTGLAAIQGVGTDALAFLTTNSYTERMRITGTGDVGIGTSTPTAKLDVNGQLNVPDQLAYDFTTSVLPDIAPTLNLNFVGANAVDPRITFTRSTTATYYDAETTALAEQNLLLYSQEFDNAGWAKFDATVTANTIAAPDGTLTADTWTAAGTGAAGIRQTMLNVSGTATASIYAKAGTKSVLQFSANTASWGVDARANFDLSSGVLGTVDASLTATITSVGGGWYRCTVTRAKSASAGSLIWCIVDSSTSAREAPATAGDIYIWGAQLELRSVVTAYNVTTTTPITNYIPQLMTAAINQPRLDFDPVTRAPKGFLIEEARTNLVIRSQEFDTAGWVKVNSTITANTLIAPDGTATADLITSSAVAGYVVNADSSIFSAAGGGTYTVSVYAKAGNVSSFGITLAATSIYAGTFNLSAGTASTSTANTTVAITAVGNGWYRCSIICASVPSTAYSEIQIGRIASGQTIYIWGAQCEAGSFATSYIPTVATTVQRTIDNPRMTGTNFSSWYNQAVGTFVVQASGFGPPSGSIIYWATSANDGTSTNTVNVFAFNDKWGSSVAVNGVGQADLLQNTSYTAGVAAKTALAYAVNDFAASVNGSAVLTDAAGSVPTVNQLSLGSLNGVWPLNGHLRSIRYYPVRLANATLQALTA